MSIQLLNNASAVGDSDYARMIRENLANLQNELSPAIENVENSVKKIVETTAAARVARSKRIVAKRSAKKIQKDDEDVEDIEYTVVRRSARIVHIKNQKKTVCPDNSADENSADENSDYDYDDDDDNEDDDDDGDYISGGSRKKINRRGSLKIRFSNTKNKKFIVDDEDYEIAQRTNKRKRRNTTRPAKIITLDVSEITPSMLANISKRVSDKKRDKKKIAGSTCHQCRQKTLDQKTYCRSPKCRGGRGFYCNICLINRYGESVSMALLNPNWTCPICRGMCNCSICRDKKRLRPTGPMIHDALAKGYKSVSEMLEKEYGETAEHLTDDEDDTAT